MTEEEESALVEKAAKSLGENFDGVVVLCSRHDSPDGTRTIAKGSGNWHTRLGIAREYVIYTEEQIREEARADVKKDPA